MNNHVSELLGKVLINCWAIIKDEEYFLKTDSSGRSPSRRHAAALHNVLNHRVSHLLNNTISSVKCVNVAASCCYVNQLSGNPRGLSVWNGAMRWWWCNPRPTVRCLGGAGEAGATSRTLHIVIKIDKYSASRALKSFGVNGKYVERAGSIFIYLSRIS